MRGRPQPEEGLRLVETMRWEEGLPLLDLHLARLRASAEHFEYSYREHFVLRLLHEGTGDFEDVGLRRLRLTLGSAGPLDMTLEHAPLMEAPVRRVLVYPEPLEMTGSSFRHKTTWREPYDHAAAWAEANGADEAILVNPRGEVVEGTRTNVWVRRGGQLLTPPLLVGGLGGVFRAHLLATDPRTEEAILTPDDLLAADAVFLSNAVHGLRQAGAVALGTVGT